MEKIMILAFFMSLFLLPNQSFGLSWCPKPSSPETRFDEYVAVLISSVEKI